MSCRRDRCVDQISKIAKQLVDRKYPGKAVLRIG